MQESIRDTATAKNGNEATCNFASVEQAVKEEACNNLHRELYAQNPGKRPSDSGMTPPFDPYDLMSRVLDPKRPPLEPESRAGGEQAEKPLPPLELQARVDSEQIPLSPILELIKRGPDGQSNPQNKIPKLEMISVQDGKE